MGHLEVAVRLVPVADQAEAVGPHGDRGVGSDGPGGVHVGEGGSRRRRPVDPGSSEWTLWPHRAWGPRWARWTRRTRRALLPLRTRCTLLGEQVPLSRVGRR